MNTAGGVVIKQEAILEARCQGHFAGDGLNVGDRRPPREWGELRAVPPILHETKNPAMASITGFLHLSKIADPANGCFHIRTMKLLGRSSRSGGCGSRSGRLGSRCFRSGSFRLRSFAAADKAEAETESDSSERDANDIHVLFFPFGFNSGIGAILP